ncbi:MAG TPA: O-antigen ligase family protein, partial [Anaerolineales bacterium]
VLGRTIEFPYTDRIFQHGFYANSMFWMMLIVLPLGQAIFNNELSLRNRLVLFGIVGLVFYIAMAKQGDWKSGWVPAAVTAGVLVAMRFKRLALLSIPFIAAVAVYLAKDLISTDLYSWGTRLDAWMVVLDISKVSPIIGMGFANYYWYATLFPLRGYSIRFNSHSQFVDIIAQTGILGLICFFWTLFEFGRLSWKLGNDLPGGFEKAYSYSMFASVFGALMAAFLVDWLLPFAYNIGLDGVRASILPWIFFGGLISLEQNHLARLKAAASNPVEASLPAEIKGGISWKN